MEVNVPEGTRSKDIKCDLKPKSICVTVNKEIVIKVWALLSLQYKLTPLPQQCKLTPSHKNFNSYVYYAGKFMGDSCNR